MFNLVGVPLRQAIVPDQLIGRVVSAYRMVGYALSRPAPSLAASLGATRPARPFRLGAAVLTTVGLLALPIVNNRTVHRARMHAAETQPHPVGPDGTVSAIIVGQVQPTQTRPVEVESSDPDCSAEASITDTLSERQCCW
jgi:hypothetical protein